MPLYEYACPKCEKNTDIRHGFDDTPELKCETCGTELKRVFSVAPIVFKGSGWYVNDSRSSNPGAAPVSDGKAADAKTGEAKSSESKSDSSETKSSESSSTETKPAATTEKKSEAAA